MPDALGVDVVYSALTVFTCIVLYCFGSGLSLLLIFSLFFPAPIYFSLLTLCVFGAI